MPRKTKSQIVSDALKQYKRLLQGQRIFSPAIGDYVHFSRRGWNHIINRRRNFKDVYRRLKLIPYIKGIVKNKKKGATERTVRGVKQITISAKRTLTIRGRKIKQTINIVTYKTTRGNITFLSVSGRKNRP